MSDPRAPDPTAPRGPEPHPSDPRGPARDSAAPPPADTSPYLRLPWPAVAAALLLLLAAAFIVGIYANRNLRPNPAPITPTPIPVAAVPPPTVPAPTAVAASTPLPTTAPTVAPTAPPTRPPAALAPAPTVDPALADEIAKAYLAFWRVRSQAALELDKSHLREVMDGEYLNNFETSIDQLRSEGHAINTQVRLRYSVVQVAGNQAIIHDQIEDQSSYVDPATQKPLNEPADDQFSIEFTLRKIDGTWKVVDSVRAA